MFDWDRDFDTLIAAQAPKRPMAGARRIRWIRPAIVAFALAAVSVGAAFVPALSGLSFTTIGQAAARSDDVGAMPAGLRTYDQSRFDNFHRGIARFSDADLLRHAAVTLRDPAILNGVMRDATLDALLLTEREIERRGLVRPVAFLLADHRLPFSSAAPVHP